MDVTKMHSYIPQPVDFIIRRIMDNGGEAYIVGGAVRDMILGRPVNDWDVATSLKPEQVESLFSDMRTIPTGKKFGTVTVIVDDMPVEVTTFRGEDQYTDYRHPDNVTFVPDIKLDLSRRDFTINAIAYNPYQEPYIVDPMDGLTDIKNKLIRSVGVASCRFSEDPLRMMRAARFLAQLDFDMEKNTRDAIINNAPLILKIASERIKDELDKLLMGDFPYKGLSFMFDVGLFKLIFSLPENKAIDIDCLAPLKALNSYPRDIILRLAAIFNFAVIPSDIDDHDFIVQELRKVLRRLRYDKQTIKHISNIVPNIRTIEFSQQKDQLSYQLKKLVSQIGEDDAFRVVFIKEKMKSRKNKSKENASIDISDTLRQILNRKEPIYISDLAITGHDLVKLGIGKNNPKIIGELLKLAQEWVLQCPRRNDAKYLLPRLQSIIDNEK